MFINYNANPAGRRTSDCVIRAISVLTGQSPEQIVKSMLQSGQISQDQFNRAVQMANAITGKKF